MILANHFSSVAPILGYVFIAYTQPGWRSVYWWCFSWELCALVMLFFFYKPPTFETKHRADQKTKWQLIREIDYVGLTLFTAGCVLILLAINWVSRRYCLHLQRVKSNRSSRVARFIPGIAAK